jgi:hypothetical protein
MEAEGKEGKARTIASGESRRADDHIEAREEVAQDTLARLGVGGPVAADFEGCCCCVLVTSIRVSARSRADLE